jgi:hypothetical protein
MVKHAMEHSRYGALKQAFIMEALTQYADVVAERKPEDFPPHSMIHPESWIGCAKELKEELEQHFKS